MGTKEKAHIVYKNKEGTIIPGVTTPIGILNKPALVYWSWDLGCKGIDFRKFKDDKADIGTLAHEMTFNYLKKETLDTSFYSKNQIDLAETCFLKYLDWEKGQTIEPILLEIPLVSERYQYGGTIDNYCLLNGIKTLIDYKTSKAIYDENFIQVSAYKQLLEENKYKVKDIIILRIGRNENEGFEVRSCPKVNKYFELFKYCLKIYNLKKELNT